MGQLPNKNNAIVDISKLEDYCLNTKHPRGKHKAKVFKTVLGISRKDAKSLRDILIGLPKKYDAIEILTDNFGTRYYIDGEIVYNKKKAVIRSTWIVKNEEMIPRLITCYIK